MPAGIFKIVNTIAAKLLFSLHTPLNNPLVISFFINFLKLCNFFSWELEKNLTLALFYCFSQEMRLEDWWKVVCIVQSRFCISYTWMISNMFNIASKYFCIFKNAPPARWVAHITRGFLDVVPVCIVVPCWRSLWSTLHFF